jgi:hypothetical protein
MARARGSWWLAVTLWLVPPAAAVAQAAETREPASIQAREYALELLLALQASIYSSRDMDDAALLGGSALLRYSFLVAGASLNAGGALFDNSVLNASLLGGLAWQTDQGLRFDLLGTVGVDQYHAEDRSLWSGDPGTSAALGCAGVRAGVWYRLGPRGFRHLIFGAFASYEENFEHVTQRYSFVERNPFFGGEGPVDAQVTFGDRRLALGLTFGVTFDLLPL